MTKIEQIKAEIAQYKKNALIVSSHLDSLFRKLDEQHRKEETPLKLKYKKETDKDLAHTDVYHGEEFLGYFIKNTSFTAEVNENWNWCGKDYQYFHARTRKELVELIRINYVLN